MSFDEIPCTEWYPGEIRPARMGYYERALWGRIVRHFWDGVYWHKARDDTRVHSVQEAPWRGLERTAIAARIEADRLAFEQWMPSVQIWTDFSRHENNEYRVSDVHLAWRCWQAGQHSPYRNAT